MGVHLGEKSLEERSLDHSLLLEYFIIKWSYFYLHYRVLQWIIVLYMHIQICIYLYIHMPFFTQNYYRENTLKKKFSNNSESKNLVIKILFWGTSLAVQWLRLHTSSAGGVGSIPGRGTKVPNATWHGQKKKKILFFVPEQIFY